MSYTETELTTTRQNFLSSDVGLTLKTINVPDTGVVADAYGFKTVKAGTIWPTNDIAAAGIIYEDVDVTNGAHAGSLMIAGRVLNAKLPTVAVAAAIITLGKSGMYFDTESETVRSID